jgi:phospholipid/cholesterol/gamma-HCH transport system permease protein
MSVVVQAYREGDHTSLVPTGSFILPNAAAVVQALRSVETRVIGCRSADVDLAQLDRIDGTGAILLARFLDQLDAGECRTRIVEGRNPDAARLITLYRIRRSEPRAFEKGHASLLARIGAVAAQLPGKATDALDFTGRFAVAIPKSVATPGSVDWRSLPRLIQEIGADALPVTSAANLLIGIIFGLLGVSQLAQFSQIARVPGLVAVAHFRELGPLVTALVMAGRAGAGIASEIGTMKVSEEIDALRSMGFDPMRWLVVPRCLALATTLPLLTWVGDLLALVGGLAATTATTGMTAYTYIQTTSANITAAHLFSGLVKTPFLALAIGLIGCGQGLATSGGAAGVGSRTTAAVVESMFCVIAISALFTFLFQVLGI